MIFVKLNSTKTENMIFAKCISS